MAGDALLREITLTLPMTPEMEIEASRAATAVAREMRMSADKVDEIRMAVIEACINALEHSGSEDSEVTLNVSVWGSAEAREPERLRITVADKGIGFEPSELREPSLANQVGSDQKRGWGLTIIRGLMDDVEIRSGEGGTMVTMTKAL